MSTIISTYKLTIYNEDVEDFSTIDKPMMNVYRETIVDEIPFGQEVESNLINHAMTKHYSNPNSLLTGVTTITLKEKAKLAIVNCNYSLEMFNPGHLTIELSLKRAPLSGSVLPATWQYTPEDVQKAFLGTKVRLEYGYDDSKGVTKIARVASDFFVYDVNTVMSSSDQNSMNIVLDVYSMDKLLDLQPMTKAYTAQKLSEIIDSQIQEVNAEFAKKKNSLGKLSIKKLGKFNMLSYKLQYMKTETEEKTGKSVTIPATKETELIFPYLVQYNETFYSFIRRVCARSGEFLYWADGAMQCGLTPSNPVNIADNDNGYKSVSTQANKSEFNVFKVTDWHRSAFAKKDPIEKKDVYPTDKYVNEGQLGNDDFLKELDVKKKPNQMIPDLFSTPRLGAAYEKYKGFKGGTDPLFKWIIKLLKQIAKGSDTVDVLKNLVVETGWSTPFGESQKARSIDIGGYNANMLPVNEKLKELYPNYQNQFKSEEQKGTAKDKKGKLKDVLSHFATAGSIASKATLGQLTEAVHAKIKAAATEAASKELIIDLDNYGTELRLGSVVTIPNHGAEQYIITHISGTFTHGNDNRLQCHRVAHAMPMAKYSDTKSRWLPAPIENDVVKAQGPMTGFVTETADPYGQGRVRVRMSWQNTSNKDATPWIRMAMPMAGKSGSLHVQPGIGDEVLVDFENGNMERPYVRGSLFNGDTMMIYSTQPSKPDIPGTLSRAFQTGKGSGLFIDDEKFDVIDWVNMVSPKMGHILSNIPVDLSSGSKSLPVGAKIELKDFFGFYSVSMSSKDRKVSIASPLGNISLNAFTGISISAPNGDITISGKNVTIKAGDRLSLSSGGNIKKDPNLSVGGYIAQVLAALIKAAANTILGPKALDLSLVRQFTDVFARPMNGTLQLHSNRHLVLEAGKGKAEIPYDSIKADASARVKNAVNSGYPYFLIRQLYETVQKVNTKTLINSYNAIVDFKANCTRAAIRELDIDDPKLEKYSDSGISYEDLTQKLSLDKCKQIYELVKQEGNTWVYGGDKDSMMKLCPIPKVFRTGSPAVVDSWRFKADEFGFMVSEYKNTLVNPKEKIDKAFDAIFNVKNVRWFDSDEMKTIKKIKTELDIFLSKKIEFGFYKGDGDFEKLPELTADKFSNDLKRADAVLIEKSEVSQQVTFIFIKCLLDAKIISYVGDQKKQPDGSYDQNFPVPSDNYYEFIGKGKSEQNWKVFTSRLVPYFKDKKDRGETGFLGELKKQAKDFGKKQIDPDWDNIMALNRIASHKERDMWDASADPGSILLSAGKGAKTTRLETGGDFKSHANPSVKMLIETFQKSHEEPVELIDIKQFFG